jgi:two-component system chemotaxis response regulator CheB
VAAAPIRILLVDDSPVALAVLRRMLSESADLEVVGTARHGREALELIPQLRPTMICTDYHMPVMDGLELTRQVMAHCPRPILVISSVVGDESTDAAFRLLEAGAVDVFAKPRAGAEADASAVQLIRRVKLVAGVFVIRRPLKETAETRRVGPAESSGTQARHGNAPGLVQMVVIGASTGGPQALQLILQQLPARFPVPILCVQHISAGFLPGLVSWLGAHCRLKLQIARPGDVPQAGHVYFPAEETHLIVDSQGRLQASYEPPVDGHRPSVTVTFRSIASRYGRTAAAVLLTGMGRDGGTGMLAVAQAGGMTIAQDEASSVIFGMPKHAIDLGAAQRVLPSDGIAAALLEAVSAHSKVPDAHNRS